MASNIDQIVKKVEEKKQDFLLKYNRVRKNYKFDMDFNFNFDFDAKKIIDSYIKSLDLEEKQIKQTKKYWRTFKDTLSIPFIWGMIVPAVFLDICLFIYQQTCFRLYGIPIVKRGDYIVFDREHLSYLNIVDKIDCAYCSYVNGLFSYAVEIGGRTEKYWCPIKHEKRLRGGHHWEKYFVTQGDGHGFRKEFQNIETFKKYE